MQPQCKIIFFLNARRHQQASVAETIFPNMSKSLVEVLVLFFTSSESIQNSCVMLHIINNHMTELLNLL